MKPVPFKVTKSGELVQIGHVREDLVADAAEAFEANGAELVIIDDAEFRALDRELTLPPPPPPIPQNQ